MAASVPGQSFQQVYESKVQLIGALKPFDLDVKSLEQSVNDYAQSAGATVKCLAPLSDIFPFIELAVKPFMWVYEYELKRRENSKKILAVRLTMKDFMVVLLELRHIPHANDKGKDGTTIADRLKNLLGVVGKHITECASDCDTYNKKHVFARTMKAKGFEEKLIKWITTFENHRKRLETSLAFHTSMGIDMANKKLDDADTRLASIEEKMEKLFRKLDTPREREIIMFLDSHGGARACLQNPTLFDQLVTRSGESYASIAGGSSLGQGSSELPNTIRKMLAKELTEDIEKSFARNYVAFAKRLEMQEQKLSAAIASETEHIIQTINSGAHDRIKDPDLREIWKDMGWKASVKARHFVMGLHDYYSDVYSKVRSSSDPMTADLSSPLVSPNMKSVLSPTPGLAVAQFQPKTNDKWALAYINATYIQPILEAVDDDGTGVVSIKEVNVFTTSRPEGWSLPHWIAYWAVGWQASVTLYKNRIYDLVQSMFRTLEHVLPANRGFVDAYLSHDSFWKIELLLRSTRSIKANIVYDPDLSRITESYATSEEERLNEKMENILYELDSPTTVSLITGGGRIERYIFPLIYLLLRQHMKMIMFACKHVLDPRELRTHTQSFVSLLQNINYRIQNLEAIFKQSHLDIQARLGNFAFGMFQLSYGNIKRSPKFNSFGTWKTEDESRTLNEKAITFAMIKNQIADVPSTMLKYGAQDGFPSANYYIFDPSRSSKNSHTLQGTWTGYMSRMDFDLGKDVVHVIRISFRVGADRRKLEGKGETYQNLFSFEGTVRRHKLGYAFEFDIDDEDGFQQKASGVIDSSKDVITMSWNDELKKDNPEDAYYRPFHMRRTPPTLVRYRYTTTQFLEDPVNARWTYALKAASHLAQERLWSRRFYRARVEERKRFVELNMRSIIFNMNFSPRQPLSQVESLELERLVREISPSEARFYQALSYFEIQKYPLHPFKCDGCQNAIIKSRILCIQCMSDDLSYNIELCSSCIDQSPKKKGFSHDSSHPVLKVDEILHDIYLAQYVENALEVVSHYRENRHEGSDTRANHIISHSYDVEPGPACSCCSKYLFAPYWACILCPRDSYYTCTDCEIEKHFEPTPHPHKPNHPMVLLSDNRTVSEQAGIEDRLMTLQQRFSDMEHKFAVGLRSLDGKVEECMSNVEMRLSDMERRLTIFEANANHRSNVLENLMRQLLNHTTALVPSGSATSESKSSPTTSETSLPPRRLHVNGRAQTLPITLPSSSQPTSSTMIADAPKSRRPLPHPPFNRPSSRLSQS